MKTIFSALLFLSALSAYASNGQNDNIWLFSDTEGKMQEAKFIGRLNNDGYPKKVLIEGKQLVLVPDLHLGSSIIPPKTALQDNEGRSHAGNLKTLSKVKGFTSFSFGWLPRTVRVIKVAASENICVDYKKKGLKVSIADNERLGTELIVFRTSGVISADDLKVNEAYFDYSAYPGIPLEIKQDFESRISIRQEIMYFSLNDFIKHSVCSNY